MSALAHCPHCGGRLTPVQQPLTERQRQVLDFVSEVMAMRGVAPTQMEIAIRFGFRSLSTVCEQLKVLEGKGYLRREHGKKQAITLVAMEAPV